MNSAHRPHGSYSDPSCMIPLHAGSNVLVSKNSLAQIFIPNACIYTSRLSELVFGMEALQKSAKAKSRDRMQLLKQELLHSIISKHK